MSCIALFISLAMRVALGSLPGASQQEAQAGREAGYVRDELRIKKLPQHGAHPQTEVNLQDVIL